MLIFALKPQTPPADLGPDPQDPNALVVTSPTPGSLAKQ